MGQVTWTSFSSGDWSDGSNWNTGSAPGAGDDALIDNLAFYTVSMTGSVTVNSVTFDNADGALQIGNSGGTDTVTAFYDNVAGVLGLDTTGSGGTTLNIGTLTNSGTITIGNSAMTAASEMVVGVLNDTGSISLIGGTNSTATAFILINGAAPGTLTSFDTLTATIGGAVEQWGSGAINQIGDGANAAGLLALDGAGADAEIGTAGGNSAVVHLGTIADNGELDLRDGAILATVIGMSIDGVAGDGNFGGTLSVDGTGAGGSHLTVGGNLVNVSTAAVSNIGAATINVGNVFMTSASTLTVDGTFQDANSNLIVTGGAVTGADALMTMTGAAPALLTGSYTIVSNVGNAALEWASGGITQIGDGAGTSGDLLVDGANAYVEAGATNNDSALDSLATIASNGTVELDDGTVFDSSTPLTIAAGGSLVIDGSDATGFGGSKMTFDDLLLAGSNSRLELGAGFMTMADTLTVNGTLDNAGGEVSLTGGDISGATALLDISNAAPATLTGDWLLNPGTGGASLEWGSGGITQIGDGVSESELELTGANAFAEVGATNSDSALTSLATIAGEASLILDGGVLNTSTSLTVDSGAALLVDNGGIGGSDITIGGNLLDLAAFAPDQGVVIGNNLMTTADTVTVDGTLNVSTGFIDLNGGSVPGATANLVVTGAAPGTVMGQYDLGADGTIYDSKAGVSLEWGSGAIVQIGDGVSNSGEVDIVGPDAHAEIGATNNNSALDTLSTIAGNGTLLVAFGGSVTTADRLTVQNGGVVIVDGSDSGGGGGGSLTIGGDLVNQSNGTGLGIQIGSASMTLASTLTVQGNFVNTGGLLSLTGGGAAADMFVSGAAPGTLTGTYDIGQGGTLRWGSGAITQIGGNTGAGDLSIAGYAAFVEVGATNSNSALNNLATIAGNGSLSVATGVTIATTATLTVQNGGVLTISGEDEGFDNSVTIGGDLINQSGANPLSNGILVGNTALFADQTLTVDGALLNQATGALTITGALDGNTASVDVAGTATNAGLVTINADGVLFLTNNTEYTQTGGTTTVSGTLGAGNATITAGMLDLAGGLVTAGTVGIGGGAMAFGYGFLNSALNNAGSVEVSGGTLTVGNAVSGTGGISVDANAVVNLSGSVTSGQTVTFNGASAVIELGNATGFHGTIAAFSAGATIDLASLNFVTGATATISGGILSVTSGGTTDTLAVSGVADGTHFTTTQDTARAGTDITISCFAANTLIRASSGEIPVEELQAGDLVLTASGEEHEIVWIGHRHVDCRRHPEPVKVWPVRISAGAFGPGLPRRDLFLSPEHAVFVDGVLIPIVHLINGTSIKSMPRDAISYYHIELAQHDILLAEDLPVESYLEMGSRSVFDDFGGTTRLFPGFSARPTWPNLLCEAKGCAPLVLTGTKVDAVRRRVAAWAATSDGNVLTAHLVADNAIRAKSHNVLFC